MVNVSWTDAVAFCRWLSEREGVVRTSARGASSVRESLRDSQRPAYEIYCLPTEAEREYACRAGSQTRWFFGDDPAQLAQYAQYGRDKQPQRLYVVGQKKPNPFGLYDMHGGVYEWCSDWFAGDYYQILQDIAD